MTRKLPSLRSSRTLVYYFRLPGAVLSLYHFGDLNLHVNQAASSLSKTMSTPNDASEDLADTNGEWSGVETDYPAGMAWVGSMFPFVPRDPRIYGPPDPLEEVPRKLHLFWPPRSLLTTHEAPGPFDDEDGDETWRKSHHGTHVYTGEEIIKTIRPPTAEQQKRLKQFWDKWEAREVQSSEASTQGQGQVRPAASEEQHFPDVLPTRSSPAPFLALPSNTTAHQASTPAPISGPTPISAPAQAPSAHHSSDVDGEYEIDEYYLPDAPQGQSASSNTNGWEQMPDSTPPKTSSPRGVDDWDDSNLLSLWKFKVIRKKGYELMLATFQDQTVESLHEAWTKHKQRCQQLGAAWEAAGRPRGDSSEWFEE